MVYGVQGLCGGYSSTMWHGAAVMQQIVRMVSVCTCRVCAHVIVPVVTVDRWGTMPCDNVNGDCVHMRRVLTCDSENGDCTCRVRAHVIV